MLDKILKDAHILFSSDKTKSKKLFLEHLSYFNECKLGKDLCDYIIKNKLNPSGAIIEKEIDEILKLSNSQNKKILYNFIIEYLKIYKNKGYNWQEINLNFKCIFFGGIGFSGSSAIFDYYHTYSDIPGTRDQHFFVKRIIKIIENSKNDYDEIFNNFLIFFFRDLMGLYSYSSPSSYRLVALGGQFFSNNNLAELISLFKNITHYIFSTNFFKDDNSKRINILIYYIFKFLIKGNKNSFLALGFLDIAHHHILKYLTNHKFIFSLRDPRDIYLDARSRNLNYFGNLNTFINTYLEKFELSNEVKKNMGSNIKVIYFENFICNKSLRDEMSEFLNIQIDENVIKKNIKYYFDLNKSKKNIGLHYYNSDEIKNIQEIERKLSSFLYNSK